MSIFKNDRKATEFDQYCAEIGMKENTKKLLHKMMTKHKFNPNTMPRAAVQYFDRFIFTIVLLGISADLPQEEINHVRRMCADNSKE